MFKAEEAVLDRFEQSFEILKNHFLKLILPAFLFYVWCFAILWALYNYFSVSLVAPSLDSIDMWSVTALWEVYSSPYVMMFIVIMIAFTLFNLLLIIPITLGTFRTIKQIIKEEKIRAWKNIMYGFENIFESFKTYWYIFAYVALIPAVLFIVFWVLLNYSLITNTSSSIEQLSIYGLVFSTILFLFFAIYRWQRTSFALASAVNENSFSKPNFEDSLKITKSNWWRIFWNFILIGFILSLIVWLINQPFKIIFSGNSIIEFTAIEGLDPTTLLMWWANTNINAEDIINSISINTDNYSYIVAFIEQMIQAFISSVQFVFILIFTFVFMRRLQYERTASIVKWFDEKSYIQL